MRVALVAGPDPGHLIPVAGLATQLQTAGHEVLVLSGKRWAAALSRTGLPFRELPLLGPRPDDDDLGYRLYGRPVEMGLPLADDLRGGGFDLVVSDTLTRAGSVAASVLDLPWVEVIPHPLPDPSVALPPFGTGWEPRPRRDRRYARRTARSLARGLEQKRSYLDAAGLRDLPPVHRLVTTLPALEPSRPDWPAATTVVAPPTWESSEVDLPVPVGEGPLLVVVGSTASGGGSVDLLAAVLAVRRPGWRIVSPRFDPPAEMPAGVTAGPGRLGPLLAAADLVVSPGGHGLVAASLRAGAAMVLVPGPGDQKEVSARVARCGAGVVVETVRRRRLPRAVDAALQMTAGAARAGDVTGLPDPVPLLEAAAR